MTDEELRTALSRKEYYVTRGSHGYVSIYCGTVAAHPFFKNQSVMRLFLEWELTTEKYFPYKNLADMKPLFDELEEMIDRHAWKKLAEYRASL